MEDLPFLPNQASTIAFDVDLLFYFLSGLSIFFTLLIAALIIYFAVRYHRRHDDEVPEQISGSQRLELLWSFPVFALGMVAFVWGAWLYFDMAQPPADALEIYVIGKQWMWKYQHPDGQQEINDLHVPVNQPIKLTMTSQDVIHSFFVPDFRVKQDVLPGRYTTLWFEATDTGEYHIFCAEYCGTEHSAMVGKVFVMEATEYEAWLAGDARESGAAEGSPADQGASLFESFGCEGCHRQDGNGPGPSMVGLFGKEEQLESGTAIVDETYLRTSILDPNAEIVAGYQPIMPTYEGQITEEQLILLIEYIKSLGTETQ